MDNQHESHITEKPEYVAPTIVDYGDLVELTAVNGSSNISDVPKGSIENVS